MLVVCGIPDTQKPEISHPTQLFIDSKVFMVVYNFFMLRIKDVPYMIKDHNLVPNQEARLGANQQHKIQVLVYWEKYRQSCGLAIIAAAWTATDLKSYTTKINIELPLVGDIKVAHPGKVETCHKWTTWDIR